MLRRQTEKAEEELLKMREEKKGRVSNVFKIVKSIQGPRKGGALEANAIADPATGDLAVTVRDIKRVSLEYCKNVLKNNKVQEGFEMEIDLKDRLHEIRMQDFSDGGFVPNRELFDKVVKKFKRNNKRNYDFLIKTGDGFKEAVYRLSKRMLEEEVFPPSFEDTTLHQIYKGRGKKEVLSNSRYIHSKEWLPRLSEGMVVEAMKEVILKKSSPYQIGGQPGHMPQEHIFSVKSILAKYCMQGMMVMLQAYDISKFFDKETLPDVMNTLNEVGIDGKAYRTWSLLNSNTNIRVKTGVGYTDWSQEGAMIGQGTGGGALVSQLNLDRGVVDMFSGSEDEVRYGSVRVLPLMFQDDIMRVAASVEAGRAGSAKMSYIMNSKQLTLNPDKTGFILCGKGKNVQMAKQEIARSPIWCGNFQTLEKVSDKWLGDIFHQSGLAESVVATIKDRVAKVKAACFEAAAIVDDWRSQCVGGFLCALDLWELAILPTLLYNAATWVEIPKQAEEILENLQLFYVRLILRVPQGAPKIALRSETGLLSMKLRVYKMKCMLIFHIRGLEVTSMARMVYDEQCRQKWPGLAEEVRNICLALGIDDANDTIMTKEAYKKVVRTACKEFDEREMKAGMEGRTKLEKFCQDDCNLKEYMRQKSLRDVRDTFRTRTQLLEGFKGNFRNKYKDGDMRCEGCLQDEDTQPHVMLCTAYEDIRGSKDMSKDEDIVEYFREVLVRRFKE